MSDKQIFESNGLAIAFAVEGAGPALALVVDRGSDLDSLATLSHLVSSADFRIVRIEADDAGQVFAVLDHLDIDHAWIGGHGTGGVVARTAAIEQHDRVNGVLLLGVDQDAPALSGGIPVLVVQATDDGVTPPANGEALRDSAPGLVSVVTIEGGGHRFPETRAGEAAWAIEDYLDWD
ncbi:alpha/beta fold hydrolase [Subtercola sp. YIM 133946]|uniref:alpha/beta fold hydrolase n=1 Tax=Subtercola sp. YIM 133946 TaxID=3118909 RepID=UPI002F94A75D